MLCLCNHHVAFHGGKNLDGPCSCCSSCQSYQEKEGQFAEDDETTPESFRQQYELAEARAYDEKHELAFFYKLVNRNPDAAVKYALLVLRGERVYDTSVRQDVVKRELHLWLHNWLYATNDPEKCPCGTGGRIGSVGRV